MSISNHAIHSYRRDIHNNNHSNISFLLFIFPLFFTSTKEKTRTPSTNSTHPLLALLLMCSLAPASVAATLLLLGIIIILYCIPNVLPRRRHRHRRGVHSDYDDADQRRMVLECVKMWKKKTH